MKILLIEPPKPRISLGGEDIHIFESLALEYIAAGVPEHNVRILDLRIENNLQSILNDFSPDIVGITSYTIHVNTVKNLLKVIKNWNPEVLTVVGGHHATVMPEDFLVPEINVVVLGEGVFTFRKIVERFQEGKGFEGIQGIAFRKDDKIIKSDLVLEKDIDKFPLPNRDLTSKYRKHYFSEWMKPLASIITSKGCPYRCSFCALWRLTGGLYLKRKPEKIVEELSQIEEEYIFFADDESLLDVKRMKTLARMIKDAGIKKKYFLYGRSDTISNNPELLEEWKDIGLERIFIGLEFFRDCDLQYINKKSTLDNNRRAVKVIQDLDISVYASFIVRPEYTKNDLSEYCRYMQSLSLDYIGLTVLTPFPGTEYYEEVKHQLLTKNYDYYDLIHTILPTKLPVKKFYKEYIRLVNKSIAPKRKFSILKKYRLRELLPAIAIWMKWMKRIKKIHFDYDKNLLSEKIGNDK
jgi:hopanoid C-3 methylase